MYCRACERPLGLCDEKQSRVSRAVRKADKNDTNIVSTCTQCAATIEDQKIIIPCASFDWHIPPHILERLLHYEKAQQSAKKSEKKKDDDDDDDDSESSNTETNSKKKKSHKEALNLQKNAALRSATRLPHLSRKGHIEDQYGHEVSLQDFFALIIAPCHVRLYDRIPKHFV